MTDPITDRAETIFAWLMLEAIRAGMKESVTELEHCHVSMIMRAKAGCTASRFRLRRVGEEIDKALYTIAEIEEDMAALRPDVEVERFGSIFE